MDLLELCSEITKGIMEAYGPSGPAQIGPTSSPSETAVADLLCRQACTIDTLHSWYAEEGPTDEDIPDTISTKILSTRLDDLLALAEEQFDLIKYEHVPEWWRQVYTDVRILMFHMGVLDSGILPSIGQKSGTFDFPTLSGVVDDLVFQLDMATIKAGAGLERGTTWCTKALYLLESSWREYKRSNLNDTSILPEQEGLDEPTDKRRRLNQTENKPTPLFNLHQFGMGTITRPVDRHEGWALSRWETYLGQAQPVRPVMFTDLMNHWPAMEERPWRKPEYLLSATFEGRRLVPVEIGRSYLDSGWTQKLMRFRDFLENDVRDPDEEGKEPDFLPGQRCGNAVKNTVPTATAVAAAAAVGGRTRQKASKKAYLAQHDLFTQIPALRRDICLHDFLWVDPPRHPTNPTMDKPKKPFPELHAWFGPAGTMTPLHTDATHNLLSQVVGTKYVRLYPPGATEALCPMGVTPEGIDMSNSSRVDLGVEEGWDDPPPPGDEEDGWEGGTLTEDERKRFKAADYVECVLNPGDTLYIPIGWWHYVKSLSVSFSVSFWWN